MKVTTKSDDPQMRSAKVPHTSITITVSKAHNSAQQAQRDLELDFVALLVRACNPQLRLKQINELLRAVVEPNGQPDLFSQPAATQSKPAVSGK